jgi:hypothetical protein
MFPQIVFWKTNPFPQHAYRGNGNQQKQMEKNEKVKTNPKIGMFRKNDPCF